jgi:hypothetical protein
MSLCRMSWHPFMYVLVDFLFRFSSCFDPHRDPLLYPPRQHSLQNGDNIIFLNFVTQEAK